MTDALNIICGSLCVLSSSVTQFSLSVVLSRTRNENSKFMFLEVEFPTFRSEDANYDVVFFEKVCE